MSDRVVVDASLGVKWVHTEPDSPVAEALLREWVATGIQLLAPALFAYEIANVLYKHLRRGDLTLPDVLLAYNRLLTIGPALDFSSQVTDIQALGDRAIAMAAQFNLPATYDPHYLALAEREGCEYWTADERLWNAVKSHLPWVRWLGERGGTGQAATQPTP